MAAALTLLPVIGVPISATQLSGQDAMLSIVQMPRGVPVATVAIDNSANAAILAAQMLGIADAALRLRLRSYRTGLTKKVIDMAERCERQHTPA